MRADVARTPWRRSRLTLAAAAEMNRRMTGRILLRLTLFLASFANAAWADLTIKTARYGTDTSFRDVRGILEAYLRNNTLSFPVNARSMGGDPNSGQHNFLHIIYDANGREFTDTVPEGGVFTFQGLPNVHPVRPPLNLPFLRPSTPITEPLVVVNRSGLAIRIYCIDRFGQWVWAANMIKGQTITLNGQLGQEWIAADDSNRVLARGRLTRGDNILWVNEPGERAPAGGFRGEEAWVRFENTSYRPLYLYNLDSLGRWNWMATLEPTGGYSASTRVGETWIATDTANHVVRQTIVAPGMARVKLF